MDVTISVIVPVFNVEKYLIKCINSILEQTFTDLELILVNDGSTDSSPHICDKYSRMDKRIKVIHKKNGGLSSARNEGIEKANGKYIMFVDSDDWVHKETLENLHKVIVEKNADIVQCNVIKVKHENTLLKENNSLKVKILSSKEFMRKIHQDISIPYIIVCNKLYKKELFKKIRFPYGKLHEDEFINYKLIFIAKKIAILENKYYFYRQHRESITNQKFNEKRLDLLEAFDQRRKFYKKLQVKDVYMNEIKYQIGIVKHLRSMKMKREAKIRLQKFLIKIQILLIFKRLLEYSRKYFDKLKKLFVKEKK